MQKHSLYTNPKKYYFYQDEGQFFEYVISLQDICIEDDKITAIYDYLEPQIIRDILVFLIFTNFYKQFISGFSHIATPLTSILRTSEL